MNYPCGRRRAKGVTMKKLFTCLMILALLLCAVSFASAETIVSEGDRNIQPAALQKDGNFALNPVIEGESPTTGLPWTGRYQPVLVQFDNSTGGVDKVRHWGIADADVVYETLLHSNGLTRISALFSDKMPEAAGPIRSTRLAHAWIRQEWQAGFCFYGMQTAQYTNVKEEFNRLGLATTKLGILFDGTVGNAKPWRKFYARVAGLASPHNAEVNVAAIQELIDPEAFPATPRPFLFSDTKPTEGDFAEFIWIENKEKMSISPSYIYNVGENVYYRYVGGEPYYDKELGPDEGHLAYANVIVQRCDTSFEHGSACPVTPLALKKGVAKGNADIFMGGRYTAGYWMRTGMDERTVFLDANGNEIAFQRGKTFIQVVNNNAEVTYSCDEDVLEQLLAEAQATIDAERAAEDTDTEDLLDSTGEEATGAPDETAGTVEAAPDTATEAAEGPVIFEEHLWGKTNAAVKVRKGPSKKDSVVGTMKKREKVTVLGEDGDWYVIYYKGEQRYVMKEFVDIDE